MARIFGTIESLKSLRAELEVKGISRFNSVGQIHNFLSNYDSEMLTILNKESDRLEKEYIATCTQVEDRKRKREDIIKEETVKLESLISDLMMKIDAAKDKSFLIRFISGINLSTLKKQLRYYVENKTTLISSAVESIDQKIKIDERFIEEYSNDKKTLVEDRARPRIRQLEYTRNILESCRNLISGAIGENLVVKEVEKLPDDYILINDFNLEFSRPIFYKKQNQRIYSIQIDHLLISKAGIFIIETKNWSESSVESLSLRSPIEQIQRSSFALYIYISESISLHDHHWGEQTVPIRNLIVMINNKPMEKFKYVSVKLLRELNDYIKYFDPVLTDDQFERIVRQMI